MKLRILRNLGSGLPDFREGEVRDVDDETASKLIDARLAVAVDGRKPPQPAPPQPVEAGQDIPPELVPATIEGLRRKADAIALGEANGVPLAESLTLVEMKDALHAAIAGEEDEDDDNPHGAD